MRHHRGWQDVVTLPGIAPQDAPDTLYFLSTQDTFDRSWETMGFPIRETHDDIDYRNPVLTVHHRTEREALAFHNRIIRTGRP